MQAGCRAWAWVMNVADVMLRLEAWGLIMSMSEASKSSSKQLWLQCQSHR